MRFFGIDKQAKRGCGIHETPQSLLQKMLVLMDNVNVIHVTAIALNTQHTFEIMVNHCRIENAANLRNLATNAH